MLERGEPGIERRAFLAGTVDFIKTGRNQVIPVLLDKLRKRLGVKFASRDPQACRELLSGAKNPIRDRDGSFHPISITIVIPESNRHFVQALRVTVHGYDGLLAVLQA